MTIKPKYSYNFGMRFNPIVRRSYRSMSEYLEPVRAADVYRYMNYDQIAESNKMADTVTV